MCGDDQPGCAEPALDCACGDEGVMYRMEVSVIHQALDGCNRAFVRLRREHEAGAYEHTVQVDGARAALSLFACILGPRHPQTFAQNVEQAFARPDVVDFALGPVNRDLNSHREAPRYSLHTHDRVRRAITASACSRYEAKPRTSSMGEDAAATSPANSSICDSGIGARSSHAPLRASSCSMKLSASRARRGVGP